MPVPAQIHQDNKLSLEELQEANHKARSVNRIGSMGEVELMAGRLV